MAFIGKSMHTDFKEVSIASLDGVNKEGAKMGYMYEDVNSPGDQIKVLDTNTEQGKKIILDVLSSSNVRFQNDLTFTTSIAEFDGDSILHRAIYRDINLSMEDMEFLIKETPVDIVNEHGASPLHYAFRTDDISKPSKWHKPKVMDLLIEKFKDVPDSYYGVSILDRALSTFEKGFPEISSKNWRLLVEGADLDKLSPQRLIELRKIATLIDLNLEDYPRLQSEEYLKGKRLDNLEQDIGDIKGALKKTMFIRAQGTNVDEKNTPKVP